MNLQDVKDRADAAVEARLEYNASDDEDATSIRAAYIAERSSYDVPRLVAALEVVERYLSDLEDGTPPEGFNGLATRTLVKNLRREIDRALA